MKKKFRPLFWLQVKGINKKKIIANIVLCIILGVIAVFFLSFILGDIIEVSRYTKDAQICTVVLNKEIGRAAFNDSYDIIQLASTGESVSLHPALRTDLLIRMSDYFPVGKEYDAVLFYYEGQKTVHLRYFFPICYFTLINSFLLLSIASFFIAVITYRRIKYADALRNKQPTKKQKDRVRHIVLLSFLVLFVILVFLLDWKYIQIYQSLFYIMFMTITLVKLTQEDYYIDLPNDENTDTT